MSVAFLWVVSPTSEVSNSSSSVESIRDGNRILYPLISDCRGKHFVGKGRLEKGRKDRRNHRFVNAEVKSPRLGRSALNNRNRPSLVSSVVASPAGEIASTSEQKVYDVVLRQAALVKRQLKFDDDLDVKPDIVLPGSRSLLSEAYDRCGEVCAEYAKTFYLGTLLMTPERRRAIWAIYGEALRLEA